MAQILVVEGRQPSRAATVLAAEGFAVVTARSGAEAAEAVERLEPDMVIFELLRPDTQVLELCRSIRLGTPTPIVILTDPCPEHEVIRAFAVGVDSVVTEPVGSHELIARMRALLRRKTSAAQLSADRVEVGMIVLDRARRELSVRGVLMSVPRREFEIAEILMREAGKVVPRRSIVRELWGSMRDTKSLDVQVGRLRGRFATVGIAQCITTIRGVGFRFASGEELRVTTNAARIDAIDLRELEPEPTLAAWRSDIDIDIDLTREPTIEESAAK